MPNYKKAGSLWFRDKVYDNGTTRKYLAGQVQFVVDDRLVTANVTIFGNKAKIHPRQPDSFLYVEIVENASESILNDEGDIEF